MLGFSSDVWGVLHFCTAILKCKKDYLPKFSFKILNAFPLQILST